MSVPQQTMLRGRCGKPLKRRLLAFIEETNNRGENLTESDIVRRAVVEFLDRQLQVAHIGRNQEEIIARMRALEGHVLKALKKGEGA